MQETSSNKAPWSYHAATVGIIAGVLLTIVSALKLCTTTCNDAHNYRLFGLPFEVVGGIYFAFLALLHYFARHYALARVLAGMTLAGGIGAEGAFIWLQKVEIGTWCPVCLSIAACIVWISICYLIWTQSQEDRMRGWLHRFIVLGVLVLGFTSSFFGISKIDKLEAAEEAIKDKIKFGNINSPIEVYVFTDWACPACRIVEPSLEAMAPKIMQQAQLTFVDAVVHPETLNFTPYNLAFMVNSKPAYFKIRAALGKLSLTNKKPTDKDIATAVAPLGVTFHELPYEDVSVALRYFDELTEQFKVTGTPTVAVINRAAKKGKKFSGAEEISESNILKSIQALR